mgnify:CR=1 FL=1
MIDRNEDVHPKDATAWMRDELLPPVLSGLPVADGIVLALTLEPVSGMTAPTGPVVSKGVASSAG